MKNLSLELGRPVNNIMRLPTHASDNERVLSLFYFYDACSHGSSVKKKSSSVVSIVVSYVSVA